MLSTTRLRNVYQHEQRQRKFVCVMNDVAKTRQDRYDHFIDTEKAEATQRSKNAIEHTRRNIVRQRVLKKCMQNKREEVEKKQASTIYGKYHGVSVEHITGEIDAYMEHNHPRIRKAQKIKDLFEEGYQKGAILDRETVKNKVKRFFDKPLVELHRIQEIDEVSSKASSLLPPIGSNFYTGNVSNITKGTQNIVTQSNNKNEGVQSTSRENEENKLFVKRKVSKFLTENVPDDLSLISSDQSFPLRKGNDSTRPVTLPAIKTGTDHVDVPKPAQGSIAELAAKFAKSKEKVEKLQRRLLQAQSSTKSQTERKPRHQNGDRKLGSHRPKSDKTGIKEIKIIRNKVKARHEIGDNVALHERDENNDDPLAMSLPPIKFKSSSKNIM